MSFGTARHQKPGQPGRTTEGEGEARPEAFRDEAGLARHVPEDSGRADLLGQVLARENLVLAWRRVKANRGSAGVDGLTIRATTEHLKTHWPRIRETLQNGSYRPQPVRRVQIPKSGGGMRELGIPTVMDRLIQQALLQILQPLMEPRTARCRPACRVVWEGSASLLAAPIPILLAGFAAIHLFQSSTRSSATASAMSSE